ncbi:MAG: MATE family efflux transporter [Cyclobacteriaceae bacterium]
MSSVLKGNIANYLLKQSGILLLGILLLASFMLIDVYFISQLGSKALAAVSYATPVMTLLVSLLLGVGAGMVVVVSNAAGQQDAALLWKLTVSCLSFALLIALLLWLLVSLGGEALFYQLGARGEVLSLLMEYFDAITLGLSLLSMLIAVTSIARALGNHKLLTVSMLLLVVINAVLDPLLIFGLWGFPQMGISGAAWATVIAIFISLWVPVPYLLKEFSRLPYLELRLKDYFQWRSITALALPIALTNVLVPLGNTLFVRMLSTFGDSAVAAYGAGSRVDMLVILSFTSLTAVMAPFIGQNLGAHKYERAYESFRLSVFYALGLGIVAAGLITYFSSEISAIFTTDTATLKALQRYLMIMPWGYAMNGYLMISITTLNVYQKPWLATALAMCQLFLFFLPIAYGATLWDNYLFVLSAYPLSHILAAFVSCRILEKMLTEKSVSLHLSGKG